jgi:hypothetical protein
MYEVLCFLICYDVDGKYYFSMFFYQGWTTGQGYKSYQLHRFCLINLKLEIYMTYIHTFMELEHVIFIILSTSLSNLSRVFQARLRFRINLHN